MVRSIAALLLVATVSAACADPRSVAQPGAEPSAQPTVAPSVERPLARSEHTKDLAAGLNAVGYDLFQSAARASDGDVVLSPLSIGVAFGMADAGASGATATALQELFDLPAEGEQRWAAFNALDQAVTDVEKATVAPANRMFPDEGFVLAPGYADRLARWFGAGVERLPLQRESEASRSKINGWVSDRTKKLIPALLPPGFIDGSTVMVLVNALYFKAKWRLPFGKYETEDAPFTRLDGSTVEVKLMHELELAGPAVAADTYAATEVPYEDPGLSMLVIVPEAGQYAKVEKRLGAELVAEIDRAADVTSVELWLPRFDSDATVDLRAVLEGELHVENVFGVPGWEGIAPGITLESAIHAANISVDEQGTVAAAATALGFAESGPPEPEITVRADRPFLYLIRHLRTGAVLFVGRVVDPAA